MAPQSQEQVPSDRPAPSSPASPAAAFSLLQKLQTLSICSIYYTEGKKKKKSSLRFSLCEAL